MRKFLSTAIILSLCLNLNAQMIFDAVRFSNNSIINGSARYMGMAGSFGALGGDVTASIDNPATLGIFRSSEASVSLGFSPIITTGNWKGNRLSISTTPFNFNNVAWVFNIPTYKTSGYLSTNLSFSYHKVKDFNRRVHLQSNSNSVVSLTDLMAGYLNRETGKIFEEDLINRNAYDDIRLDWISILGYDAYLIDPVYDENDEHTGKWVSILDPKEKILPAYRAIERGNISDYNFTYSGNVNDRVYFGAGISMQSVSYSISSVYSEDFPNNRDYFDLRNNFSTSGFGVNLKFGAIFRATDFMRIGLSFQTPTWYSMRDWHVADLKYSENRNEVSTPEADYWYQLSTPLKAQASVGFIIGGRAAINVDYQFSDKHYSMSDDFMNYKVDKNNDAKYLHTVKLGAELRLGNNFKVRGGGAFISAPINQDAKKIYLYPTTRTDLEYFITKNTCYGTFGIGYAKNGFSLDFAYVYQQQNQKFYAFPTEGYDDLGAKLKTQRHHIVATMAFRY